MNILVSSWRRRQLLEAYTLGGVFSPGVLVLDIGCGNGEMGRAVAQAFGVRVEGADIVNLLEEDLSFHALPESWEKWPVQYFDVTMLNDALHHMSPDTQISTLGHALRVGKKVLIFETRPTMLAKFLDVVMGRFVYGGRETITLTHREPEAWTQILKELGWRTRLYDLPRPFFYPLRHFVLVVEPR